MLSMVATRRRADSRAGASLLNALIHPFTPIDQAKATILRTLKSIRRSIKAVRQLRTLDEFAEGYFRDHPDEIDDYLTEIFQDFAKDNDTDALLAALRVIARVRGISDMAQRAGMTRQGIQKALSVDGNPPHLPLIQKVKE